MTTAARDLQWLAGVDFNRFPTSVSAAAAFKQWIHVVVIGVPMYLKLDKSDDLLNPTRGYRARVDLTPYQSFSGPNLSFVTGDHSFAYVPARDVGVSPQNGFGGAYIAYDISALRGTANYVNTLIPHAVVSPWLTYTGEGWGAGVSSQKCLS